MPDPLDALIARLSEAQGPDRWLDRDIYLALNPLSGAPIVCPKFSASLDAAMALVEGGYWEISGPRRYLHIPSPVPNRWRASIITADGTDVIAWGATAPLAAVSAALRARAPQPREGAPS